MSEESKRAPLSLTLGECVDEMHERDISYRRGALPCGCKLIIVVCNGEDADRLHGLITSALNATPVTRSH